MPNKYEQGVEAFKQYRLYSKSDNQEDYELVSKIATAMEYEHGRAEEAGKPIKWIVYLSMFVIITLVVSLLYLMVKYHIS